MLLDEMTGKVFCNSDCEEFGVIRPLVGSIPEDLAGAGAVTPFAEDGCGNFFVLVNDVVAFWDHETGETISLANTIKEFIANLKDPEPIVLQEGQVKSVWINPEFAKTLGLNDGKK